MAEELECFFFRENFVGLVDLLRIIFEDFSMLSRHFLERDFDHFQLIEVNPNQSGFFCKEIFFKSILTEARPRSCRMMQLKGLRERSKRDLLRDG